MRGYSKVEKSETILKVVVGSVAHGLAKATSDTDYRGVFVTPTSELLKIGAYTPKSSWLHESERSEKLDDVSWEIGHFLFLAIKCNPTVLETFLAPDYTANAWGEEVRALFPSVWNSIGVASAFIGYAHNQRKKLLEDKDKRRNKYATAYVRTLYNAWELLSTGTFHVDVRGTEIEQTCRRFRAGEYRLGEVIDVCATWETRVKEACENNPDKQADLAKVNDLLLRVRKAYWS
jgi:uncharacterized protein